MDDLETDLHDSIFGSDFCFAGGPQLRKAVKGARIFLGFGVKKFLKFSDFCIAHKPQTHAVLIRLR